MYTWKSSKDEVVNVNGVYEVGRYENAENALMNVSIHPFDLQSIVVGEGEFLQPYEYHVEAEKVNRSSSIKRIQTDFFPDEMDRRQKLVKFSRDGQIIVTAGEDQVVRCWTFPGLNLLCETSKLDHIIRDLDLSHQDNHFIVATTTHCSLYQIPEF